MVVRQLLKPSAYFDSITLMLVQRDVRQLPGVEDAGLVMGTDANKELLRGVGLLPAEAAGAHPDDLVVVVRAISDDVAAKALAQAEALLVQRRAPASSGSYQPKTVAAAAQMLSGANLALISVPGRFAAGVAKEALAVGVHVMLFSDNVPLEAEVDLKRTAAGRGLMVMGPDCGTAILGGLGLGFANRVRRGTIGIVGASGTGIQEVASLIHRAGGGISQAIGTGGRDLNRSVRGITTLQGLSALAADPETKVIVVISKPPAPEVASQILGLLGGISKPIVVAFLGASVPAGGALRGAITLEEAAQHAVTLATGTTPRWPQRDALPAQEAGRLASTQKFVRGLYSGGTLCYEALVLLPRYVGPVYSNTPLDPAYALPSPLRSRNHSVIDMGSDELTVGRLHPMLDPELRSQRLVQEAADPEVAVILLDVVLGYGVHPDPARELAAAIRKARAAAQAGGRWLPVVASVCGTDEDPQNYDAQVASLVEAGAIVQASNAQAVRLAGLIAEAAGSRGHPHPLMALPAPASSLSLPNASESLPLLRQVRVINVGLQTFADSLTAQGADIVAVDWRPPAGGKQHLIDILDKLNA